MLNVFNPQNMDSNNILVTFRCNKNWSFPAFFEVDTPHPKYTLPKFNITPENWWLEDDPFLLGPGIFSGASC